MVGNESRINTGSYFQFTLSPSADMLPLTCVSGPALLSPVGRKQSGCLKTDKSVALKLFELQLLTSGFCQQLKPIAGISSWLFETPKLHIKLQCRLFHDVN